jgi:hypothetical protein
MTEKTFTAYSRKDIERKIDTFLVEDRPFRSIDLILPACGSARRYTYRGLSVREWNHNGNIRFDAAVSLL